ncbi:nitroreductase [Luteimonas sp. M1R5S59]|uniref:Putative NAD(P)H nitroreductase n=1 Tax=Luteimonas kalidii TaxID=3042025 RepID=A0ABT6JRQ8_9GAMM|nr:nitroreductase [Luteimonas kalidii]MDH5833157.1 nitroreductase [Luteimonas kalidii]
MPLDFRRSVPARQLGEPGPDEAMLLRLLRSAVRVPDHGKRVPFRFVRIAGEARARLGEALAAITLRRDPAAGEAVLDKDRQRFSHAPVVVAVVAVLDPADTQIPDQERLLTAGCACFALLQAAQSFGFGACWLTGWPAYDEDVRALLGLTAHDTIAGFIHIGTPVLEAPERERPDPRALLSDLVL